MRLSYHDCDIDDPPINKCMNEKKKLLNQRISSAIYLLMLTKWLPLMLWRPGIAAAISKHAFPSSCIERLCWEGWRVGASDGKIEPTKLVSNCYQYSIYIYMITAATYTHTAILSCLLFAAHRTHMKLINSDITKDIMTIYYWKFWHHTSYLPVERQWVAVTCLYGYGNVVSNTKQLSAKLI